MDFYFTMPFWKCKSYFFPILRDRRAKIQAFILCEKAIDIFFVT